MDLKSRELHILVGITLILVGGFFYWKSRSPVHILCDTTKGPIEIVVQPSWSPIGANRFLELVDDGFYTDLPFFRCIENFVCQFGSTPPRPSSKRYSNIADDPKIPEYREFKVGYLSFAGYAANSRSTHVFIALAPVETLGTETWETPFGYVTPETLGAARNLTTVYGESAPDGKGPIIEKIESPDGAAYLKKQFPLMDYFRSCHRK